MVSTEALIVEIGRRPIFFGFGGGRLVLLVVVLVLVLVITLLNRRDR